MNDSGISLLRAAQKGDRAGISRALQLGADPDIRNKKGETPLMLLCASDQEVRWFSFEDISDYDGENESGDEARPPITKSLEELLMHGANIYASNSYKQDAIFYAVCSEGTWGLRWLLQNGVHLLDNKDDFGNTALDGRRLSYTSEENLPAFCGNVAMLLAYGAKWSLQIIQLCTDDNPYRTPCDLTEFLENFDFLTNKQHSTMIHSESNLFLYENELQHMYYIQVTSHKTLLDILYIKRSVLYLYEHQQFINYFRTHDQCFKKPFPKFGLFLNAVFDKSLLRYNLLKKSCLALENFLCIKLENNMLEKMFMYFSNYELKTLMDAIN